MPNNPPYTVVFIVPTGIGAAIGGYAGDALPVVRAMAAVADRVITHPNVLNGAQLYWPIPNALYVEGYGLDQFAAGHWGLQPVHQNRIGLILDQAIEPELQLRHLQAADAARATLGLNLTDYIVTDRPLQVTLNTAASGATWGTIGHPDSLLRAADRLIHQAGATAIAVVTRFPDDLNSQALQDYRHGHGVDPLAGAEAVISHLLVRHFALPCAHAPALQPLPIDPHLSPRSAAEEIGHTFLPCVLVGLSQAPQFVRRSHTEPAVRCQDSLWSDNVDALVIPATACGGSAVLSFSHGLNPSFHPSSNYGLSHHKPRIIAVQENHTRMQVTPSALGIQATVVPSYLSAIGVIACDRAGIDPKMLQPHLTALRPLPTPLPEPVLS